MTENRAVFTIFEDKYVLIHFVENEVKHLFVYDDLDAVDIGTIINCRIDRRIDNIEACFVRYDQNAVGYMNKIERNNTLKPLVLKKEGVNGKKPLFSDVISIEGEYVVVSSGQVFSRASVSIPEQKRAVYTEAFIDKCKQEHVGVIVRTAAYTEENGLINAQKEFDKIIIKIKEIISKAEHVPQYTVLYKPPAEYIRDINYLVRTGCTEVVTDVVTIMDKLRSGYESVFGPVNLTDRVGLRFYDDKLVSLAKLYSIGSRISECLSRKVYLKSGAYITIDTTEALTAIDVNTASNSSKATRSGTFLAVNIEAATEVVRQLILRNIAGMIIIDFINMDSENDYTILKDHIIKEIGSDREHCRFIDFTGLKLCELTRSRRGKSLYQSLRRK